MRKEQMMEAYLDSYDEISIYIHELFYQGKSETFRIVDQFGKTKELKILGVTNSSNRYSKYICKAPNDIVIGNSYFIVADYALRCELSFGYVVRSKRFEEEYKYDGPLGVEYNDKYIELYLWAPTASEVKVSIGKNQLNETYTLKRKHKGVWYNKIEGNFDGYEYNYLVKVNGIWVEAIDPYAISANANKRKGFIINPNKVIKEFNKENLPDLKSNADAIIYETSVRDFSKQFDSKNAGKYLGMIEKGYKTAQGHKAGFDHLVDLGATHVQLMPILDFTSVDEENVDAYYNWGYDPGHYMIPEGSYASDPNDPYARIIEIQQMVKAFHDVGIRVNLDVVYNHMRDRINSDYEKIVPNYYFRLSDTFAPSNGSYCGNDFDSTKYMTQRAIIDSLKHWLSFYGVDGFRFDLMGILDVDTMNLAYQKCLKIDANVMFYGEGWNMPTLLPEDKKADMNNQLSMPMIGHFNDYFRDHVKGNNGDDQIADKGYATGDISFINTMPSCLVGCSLDLPWHHCLFDTPIKSINYVECHDGYTIWDKMKSCNSGEETNTRVKRDKLMMALILLSQGVPFIHSGQEFARSKQGVSNSYASSDSINMINWNRIDKYYSLVSFTKDLIDFRKKQPALRFKSSDEITNHCDIQIGDNQLLVYKLYNLHGYSEYDEIIVFFNATMDMQEYRLDRPYNVIMDQNGYNNENAFTDNPHLEPLSIMILGVK